MSYVRPGYYYWETGRFYHQTVLGGYWSSSQVHSASNYNLYVDGDKLTRANTNNKRLGRSMRCVTKLACQSWLQRRTYPKRLS